MATISAKEVVVTWDGDPATWGDYARKVRLQWKKTPDRKKKYLAPDLASRLTGRAWSVTPDLEHAKLSKKNGTKYLLKFLQSRLCRTAVPDAGARLEDLLIRLRRPLGMPMSQWSSYVLEAYRKVQRALVRARQQKKPQVTVSDAPVARSLQSEPQAEPPSRSPTPPSSPTARAAADTTTTSPSSPTARAPELRPQDDIGEPGEQDAREEGHDDPWQQEEGWTAEEWRQWRRERRHWEDSDNDTSSPGEDLPWDELEIEDIQVLPDEVLGWLLLRRANLSAASRLSVQASVQNSLTFRDIETALRDQEEELLQADASRHPSKRHTYWVEESGSWGLLVNQDETTMDEVNAEVHWVGHQLPPEVYDPGPMETSPEEDQEIYWTRESDGWHGYAMDWSGEWYETDGHGAYWACDDSYMDDLTPEENKELEEAYAVYENKAKTFLQSRQFQRAKGKSRGFYPPSLFKGQERKRKEQRQEG